MPSQAEDHDPALSKVSYCPKTEICVMGAGGSGGTGEWRVEPTAWRDPHNGQWQYGIGVSVDASKLIADVEENSLPLNLLEDFSAPPWLHSVGWALLGLIALIMLARSWADRGVVVVPTRVHDTEPGDETEELDEWGDRAVLRE